jgi:outer membrane lipoprotein-sorting protein
MRRIVLLLAAALVVSACGGGDSVSAAPVAEAATKTTEAGSSRIEFTMAIEAEGKRFRMSGDGVFDYSRPRGRIMVDLGNLAELSRGALVNRRMEFVFDGLTYYMRFPEGLPELHGLGDKWLKLDLGEVNANTALDLGALQQVNQNPAQLLQFLRGTSDDIEELGQEDVRGVETTHYRAEVDLDEAAKRGADIGEFSDEMREQLEAEIERVKRQTGLETLPVDVWLDQDDLVRRMRMNFSFGAEGDQVGMDMTMDFFDFGVDVRVRPPAADQTVDITALAGGGGS